jgi:UDP-GlcNAc:undecaprenyl-phosphate/decaprenyl-phosphate GlcNAc-1-phosphate transferase
LKAKTFVSKREEYHDMVYILPTQDTSGGNTLNHLLGLIIGMVISLVIIPIMWRLEPRLRMLDKPDPRKVHRQAIPRVGGWGIVLGALLPVLILLDPDPLVQSYLIGSIILFLFGA